MLKVIFNQFVAYLVILSCYIVLGFVLPIILFDITIPAILIFTWLIAPVVTTLATTYLSKYLKIGKVKPYIVISFGLNFVCILIYTWIDSRHPYIEGNFIDFRGLYFWVCGIGQIVGVIFTLVWSKVITKSKNL